MDKEYINNLSKFINYNKSNIDYLDKIIDNEIETEEGIKELLPHQRFFINSFLPSEQKSIFVNHDTGSGKTFVGVGLINNLDKIYSNWKIFILCKKSLMNNWSSSLPKKLKYETRIINYLNNKQLIYFLDNYEKIKDTKHLIIIDEIHNITSSVSEENRYSFNLYNSLIRFLKVVNDYKLVLMSATPIINYVTEFNMILKLLKPNIINIKDELFNDNEFVYSNSIQNIFLGYFSKYPIFDEKTDDIFVNRERTDNFPERNIYIDKIPLTKTHKDFYLKNFKTMNVDPFKTILKIALNINSNKVLHDILRNDKSSILSEIDEIKKLKIDDSLIKFIDVKNSEIFESMELFESHIYKKIKNVTEEIRTIVKENYENYKTLADKSIKFLYATKLTYETKGKVLIYSKFKNLGGAPIISAFLNLFNISNKVITSDISENEQKQIIKDFNSKDNLYGEKVKVIIFSNVANEGVNFSAIRTQIMLTVPWNETSCVQILGRSYRSGKHNLLPENERTVNCHLILGDISPIKGDDEKTLEIIFNKIKELKIIKQLFSILSIEFIYKNYKKESFEKFEDKFTQLMINQKNKFEKRVLYSFEGYPDKIYEGYLNENKTIFNSNRLIIGSTKYAQKIKKVDSFMHYIF